MQTLNDLLSASTLFDNQKRLIERATKYLELSEEAYIRYLERLGEAERQSRILKSPKAFRYPFINSWSVAKAEQFAEYSKRAYERLYKGYKATLFSITTEIN